MFEFHNGGLRVVTQDNAAGFWENHSRYQVPADLLELEGGPESLVLIYFYDRAASESYRSKTQYIIQIKVKEATIAKWIGQSLSSVLRSIKVLARKNLLKVVAGKRDKATGRKHPNSYELLNPETGEALTTSPPSFGIGFGVCHTNGVLPFLTVPKEILVKTVPFEPSGRVVYFTCLSEGSKKRQMKIRTSRAQLMTETRLKERTFNHGLKVCRDAKLITFDGEWLTLLDPQTGKPTERYKCPVVRIKHSDPKWQLDFKQVTSEEWQGMIEQCMKEKFQAYINTEWSATRPDTLCPFCKKSRAFTVNFIEARYLCHECKKTGMLGSLLGFLLNSRNGYATRAYINQYRADAISAALQRVAI